MIVLNAILEERRKRDNARCLAYYRANRERLQEANAQWKKDNPDKVRKHQRTQNNKYHHLSKEQKKEWSLKANYGITYDQFTAMLDSQSGCCAICGIKMVVWEGQGKTDCACVDHCHATGVIRGLLCGACNRAIGLLKDDPAILDKASQYLRSLPPPPPPPDAASAPASPADGEGGGGEMAPELQQVPPEMSL